MILQFFQILNYWNFYLGLTNSLYFTLVSLKVDSRYSLESTSTRSWVYKYMYLKLYVWIWANIYTLQCYCFLLFHWSILVFKLVCFVGFHNQSCGDGNLFVLEAWITVWRLLDSCHCKEMKEKPVQKCIGEPAYIGMSVTQNTKNPTWIYTHFLRITNTPNLCRKLADL